MRLINADLGCVPDTGYVTGHWSWRKQLDCKHICISIDSLCKINVFIFTFVSHDIFHQMISMFVPMTNLNSQVMVKRSALIQFDIT